MRGVKAASGVENHAIRQSMSTMTVWEVGMGS
jgi:hypothetical protein